ncbi:cyclin-dependent kinase b2-2 [Phtheirospermum japonicum]|uniref:Cyclin-dependent kinase b2-2 n=1 Tax=Phtheirospermum japonicum TaxID=374723 RepID=A0A830CMQ4_9LAMI|nr:cyclin-dependent kinase b2-2 [Phtheirospermum japonicum]
MGLLDLFIASTNPVLKVLLVTGLGSYLALDHVSILVEDARKHLNNITFYVLNPALVSSNLAKTITYDSMVKMWFMPFNILFTFIIGSILGWVIVHITRAPPHLRGLIMGCCAAGNLGNLLFIIIPAVCKEKASPFGDPNVCHENGMGYASLSMAIGAIYLWSYVYNIVRVSTRSSMEVEIIDSPVSKSAREKSSFSRSETISNETQEPLLESGLALPQDRFENKPQIAGFVVGLVPQIRKLLIGDTAPLRVVQDSALLLGDGAIPAVTLIMGGNLLKGLKGSGIQKSIIFSILAVRYIALPLIGIAVVKGAVRFGVVQDDRLYQFVLLLQYSLPPAMNIGTITQLFGVGESECSVIMLWCYVLASVALTLWSTFFLWLVK